MLAQSTTNSFEVWLKLVLMFGVFVVIYFIPTFVAASRKGKHHTAIFVINLFLGWTLLGWVGALVWAVVTPKEEGENESLDQLSGRLDLKHIEQKPSNDEASMSADYQIARGGVVLGRKTPKEISNLLVDGKLSLDDLFLNEQTKGWDKIRHIKNLPL
jgi:hypothetical protein